MVDRLLEGDCDRLVRGRRTASGAPYRTLVSGRGQEGNRICGRGGRSATCTWLDTPTPRCQGEPVMVLHD